MTDNQDGEIRWRVIGAVVVQLFAAGAAGLVDLQISPKDATLAAGRAAADKAAFERLPARPRRLSNRGR